MKTQINLEIHMEDMVNIVKNNIIYLKMMDSKNLS
jgi:hypothetical protein